MSVLETRGVYVEFSLVAWNLPSDLKHPESILKNMASSEGDQLLAGAFHAIVDKIETDILQIVKKWNWIWIFTHQGYFFRNISAMKCQFCTNDNARVTSYELRVESLKARV